MAESNRLTSELRARIYTHEAAQVRQLPNGLTLLLEPLPYLRTVTSGVWIKAGSANEALEKGGISHFLEHLFFKGTKNRSARQLMEAIERRGGHINAFTSRDYTCVYTKMLDTRVGMGIEILGDILKNSLFLDLEKERNVILEEIASIEDVPEDYIHDAYAALFWPDHPLGRPVTGTMETVSALSLDDIQCYYRTWYRPENMYVAVVGNFDVEAVYHQLADEFSDLETGPVPERFPTPRTASALEFEERDIGQDHLCFGFPGPSATDPDRYTYEMLSSILGGGSTSRLFEKVREDAGLAYSVYTFNSSYLNGGAFGIYAALAPENLHQAFELCLGELRDVRDHLLTEDELELNREQIKGGVLMALESTSNRMSRLAKSMMYHNRIVPVDEIIDNVEAVTAEDVQRLAASLFTADRCTTLVLGPAESPRIERVDL